MHAGSAERIDGKRRAQRRVDPARETEHDARKPVLVDVVAKARDAGEIVRGLVPLDRGDLAGAAAPLSPFAPPFGRPQRFLPGRQLHHNRSITVQNERGAVEHKLILSADLIDIGEREPRLGHALARDVVTNRLLANPIRRAVRHDQKLGAGSSKRLACVPAPNILADGHAERHAAKRDRLRQRACGEHALFVEHAVIRQIVFVPHRLDAAAIEQRDSIVDRRALAPGQTHEHGRTAVLRLARERLARLARRLLQRGLEHEILGRIAGEEELGEGDEVSALFRRARAGRARHAEIAFDIAQNRVELRESELEPVFDRLGHDRNLVRNNLILVCHGRAWPGHPRLSLQRKFVDARHLNRWPGMTS